MDKTVLMQFQCSIIIFYLDVIAFEIQKLLINVYKNKWDREIQKDLLLKFLLFDNFQDVDRDFAKNFLQSESRHSTATHRFGFVLS